MCIKTINCNLSFILCIIVSEKSRYFSDGYNKKGNIMLKTITFAILHFGVAFSVAYILTGSIGISGAVALIEPMVNTVVFYFHEKVWNRYERKTGKKQEMIVPLHQCVFEHKSESKKQIEIPIHFQCTKANKQGCPLSM